MNPRHLLVALAAGGVLLLGGATSSSAQDDGLLPNPVLGPFADDARRQPGDTTATFRDSSGWTRDIDGDNRPDRYYCCGESTATYIFPIDGDGNVIVEVHKDRDNNGYFEYVEFDSGGDGLRDVAIVDLGEDGTWNQYGWAPDPETGKVTEYALDEDGDRVPEVRARDSNGDGRIDVRGTDEDGDGFFGDTDVDTDFDGDWDVTTKDTNGDGRSDERWTYGNEYGPSAFDRNFDGTPDEFWEDTDGDMRVDQVRIDTDLDGTIDTVYRDNDRNGTYEQADITGPDGTVERRTDTDDDGEWDVFAVDTDGNGTFDTQSYDRDGDGTRDAGIWARDTNNDGVMDTRFEDTNGDGQADKITASDADGQPVDGAAIEYDRMGDGEFEQRREDADGNGTYDTLYIDLDGDGTMETTVYDTDENGIFEVIERDRDGDGLVDEWVVDGDGDGQFDSWERDQDGDGNPDVFSYDRDGDGERDKGNWFVDTDGDGIPDLEMRDTDGNGLADEVIELQDLSGDAGDEDTDDSTASDTEDYEYDPCETVAYNDDGSREVFVITQEVFEVQSTESSKHACWIFRIPDLVCPPNGLDARIRLDIPSWSSVTTPSYNSAIGQLTAQYADETSDDETSDWQSRLERYRSGDLSAAIEGYETVLGEVAEIDAEGPQPLATAKRSLPSLRPQDPPGTLFIAFSQRPQTDMPRPAEIAADEGELQIEGEGPAESRLTVVEGEFRYPRLEARSAWVNVYASAVFPTSVTDSRGAERPAVVTIDALNSPSVEIFSLETGGCGAAGTTKITYEVPAEGGSTTTLTSTTYGFNHLTTEASVVDAISRAVAAVEISPLD